MSTVELVTVTLSVLSVGYLALSASNKNERRITRLEEGLSDVKKHLGLMRRVNDSAKNDIM